MGWIGIETVTANIIPPVMVQTSDYGLSSQESLRSIERGKAK
jgi:hypothetical protein